MSAPEQDPIQYATPLQPLPEGWCLPSVGSILNFQRSSSLGIVPAHHPALHQVAQPIPSDAIQTADTRELIARLQQISESELKAGRSLVGLAAPQIGVSRCVFLANYSMEQPEAFDPLAMTVMINPQLRIIGSGTLRIVDGCFSCGPLIAATERPTEIYARWFDIRGKEQQQNFTSFGSVVVGHENDHLNGRLFPDLALDQGSQIAWLDPERRSNPAYRDAVLSGTWGKICPDEQWKAMKRPNDEGGPKFRLEDFDIPQQ